MIEPSEEMRTAFRQIDGDMCDDCLDERLAAVLSIVERDQAAEPIHLPWSYWDGVVETELRVDDYPYGGGVAGSGLQLTLGQRSNGQIIAVRLPREAARRLAMAILAGPERPS